MEAVTLTDADLAQRRTDQEVGEEQALANADHLRKSVRSARPLRADE